MAGKRYESPGRSRRLFSPCVGVVSLLLLFGGGCGRGGPPPNEAVSGAVTWKGKPLDQGTIEFSPTDGQGAAPNGLIQDGRYHLRADPGVAPGTYRVRISSVESPLRRNTPDAPPDIELIDPKAKERIPSKYNRTTKLQAEVKKGGGNTFDFHLE